MPVDDKVEGTYRREDPLAVLYSPRQYSGNRTALDDAIDRCSNATGNAYDPRIPADIERERREQGRFRDWVQGRRDSY
jgi:hypothetical protein